MLCPKRTRYKKYQKGKNNRHLYKFSDTLQFGRYGIKAKTSGSLKSNTVEAVRRVISRKLKRNGQIWIRIFPDSQKSCKPLATRMGKGKGNLSYWYVPVSAGQMLFEMDGIPEALAQQACQEAEKKLAINLLFIK